MSDYDVSDPRRVVAPSDASADSLRPAVEEALGFDQYVATAVDDSVSSRRYNPAVDGYTQSHDWTDEGWKPVSDDPTPLAHYQEYVPTDALIDLLVAHSPIVEVGAGNGYLTHVINKNGGDSIATDAFPPDPPSEITKFPATWAHYYVEETDTDYTVVGDEIGVNADFTDPTDDTVDTTTFERTQWCPVVESKHVIVDKYPNRSILVAHPGGATAWTEDLLTLAENNDQQVLVVAEWYPGQDATPVFFERLHTEWQCIDRAPVYNRASTHAAGYVFTPSARPKSSTAQ